MSYERLLDTFWRNIDPTDPGGSFVDRGIQYSSAIFYQTDEEKRLAELSKDRLEKSGIFDKPIVTKIIKFEKFYRAEEYHQDYYKKNPIRYKYYRAGSGRDPSSKKIWKGHEEKKASFKKPSDDELRKRLMPLQYEVTRKEGTEPAYKNEYWDNHQDGIYVDIISGEPLFSSLDKYDSGTGWPSFTKPLEPRNIVEKEDHSFFMRRIKVTSKQAGTHLGHVFNDGPKPTGLRYCLNSAALRLIPKEDLVPSFPLDNLPQDGIFFTSKIILKGGKHEKYCFVCRIVFNGGLSGSGRSSEELPGHRAGPGGEG